MLVINFKTYKQATGSSGLKLAKICEATALKHEVEVIIGAQVADIRLFSSQINIPVFAQHIDPVQPDRSTGFTTAFSVKQAGAKGVFLNHSEHYYQDLLSLEKAVDLAKQQHLKVLVFVKDLVQAKAVDKFSPDYIALEEPSMVSGDVAMVKVKKMCNLIKTFSQSIESVPLVGAGIKTAQDIKESLNLGTKGVALASGFVKASDPKQVLESLVKAF